MNKEPERDNPGGDEPVDSYLWDGRGEADPFVARLEGSLAPARWSGRAPEAIAAAPQVRVGAGRRAWGAMALAAAVVLMAAGAWFLWPESESGWRIESLAGAPRLGRSVPVAGASVRPGQWLRTDAKSTARLIGDKVGWIDVQPGSDLRLLKAAPDEQRLELAQGSISAFVTTPPRVFFVETPAATAVDMGCAYKLKVDEKGEGTLYVTLGWVELHVKSGGRDLEVRVPSGAACHIGAKEGPRPGPGTPWFEDAEVDFRTALDRVDAGQGGLDEVLSGARVRDSLTLWHLAARLTGAERAKVRARLAELVPAPDGVGIATLDEGGLERWWGVVRASW